MLRTPQLRTDCQLQCLHGEALSALHATLCNFQAQDPTSRAKRAGGTRGSQSRIRRYAWDQLAEAEEVADDYGLGARDSLQDAVEAVIAILGMKVGAGMQPKCFAMWVGTCLAPSSA